MSDPVMRKEFYGLSRRWQTYAFRVLYVGVLALVLAMMFVEMTRYGRMNYSRYARLGQELFIAFSMIQYGLLALGAALASADMIAKEVRGGTLGILSITPLSPLQIAVGKWKSCLGHLVLLLLSGVPVLSIGIYLGGAEGSDLVEVVVITLATAMLCAAFGVYCSTFFRGYYTTLVATLMGLAAYAIAPILFALMFDYRGDEVIKAACWVHPFISLVGTLVGRSALGGATLAASWATSSACALLLAALFLHLAARRIARVSRREPQRPVMVRVFRAVDETLGTSGLGWRIWSEKAAVWDFHPHLWKELRTSLTGRLRTFIWITSGLVALLIVCFWLVGRDLRWADTVRTFYGIIMSLMILASIGAGASAFTKEKEEKRWDILLTTPMTAAQVLSAKLAGALLSVAPLAIVLCVFSLLTWTYGHLIFPPVVLSTLLFSGFTVCVGMFVSLRARTTRVACAATFGVVAAAVSLIPFACALHSELARVHFSGYGGILAATNLFAHLEWVKRSQTVPWEYVAVFGALYAGLAAAALAQCGRDCRRVLGACPERGGTPSRGAAA